MWLFSGESDPVAVVAASEYHVVAFYMQDLDGYVAYLSASTQPTRMRPLASN